MRKLILTTAAVAAAIGVAGCGKKEPVPETPNTFTDTRDGQTYKTVTIGTQTWMAQNINYKTKSGSWCYRNSADSCNKYGRLYDWKTATTVCPKGWKLPSNQEWGSLVTMAGGYETAGKKLKSKSGWNENGNGTDDYGFSALPGGFRAQDGSFSDAGYGGYWWTATEYSDGFAYFRDMGYYYDHVIEYDNGKGHGFSARCVHD
jgi:uncharacterized protein (TIGR02145 family)